MEKQRQFIAKFYKRCSHSYERPYMVDRGIQIILNSTTWEKESHQEVYREMKVKKVVISKIQHNQQFNIPHYAAVTYEIQWIFRFPLSIGFLNELYYLKTRSQS